MMLIEDILKNIVLEDGIVKIILNYKKNIEDYEKYQVALNSNAYMIVDGIIEEINYYDNILNDMIEEIDYYGNINEYINSYYNI